MTRPVAPTREDGVARAASELVGGAEGRRAGAPAAGWWTPARLLVALTVPTLLLAVLTRGYCRATGWASPAQFTHACYSDLPALYVSSGLDRGVVPLLEPAPASATPQPVGTHALLALLAWLAPSGDEAARWVFDLGVLLVAASLVATVLVVALLAGHRRWDAALVALSPVVVVAGLVSLDLVAVALAAGSVLALARRRPVLSGLLLAAAVTVRPLALLVLVAVVLLAVRSGRAGPALRLAAAAGAGWLALNVPVLVLNPGGWTAYWSSLASSPVGYGSLWLLPQLAGGGAVPPGVARWLSAVGVTVVVVAVALVCLGAGRRPRLPAVVLLLVVGVLSVSVAVPVQASLWLLPFAALAVPRWRDHLLWGGAEAAYATGTWLYLYGLSVPERGLPAWAYATLLVLRLAAMAWLAWQAVRAVRDPGQDPVRAPGDARVPGRDDPAGGPFEGAQDALVVRTA